MKHLRSLAFVVALVDLGCASSSLGLTPDGAATVPVSPWWASLFFQGATSEWTYTFTSDSCDQPSPDEDAAPGTLAEEHVTTSFERAVRCTVDSVDRVRGLWVSKVRCELVEPVATPEFADARTPAGDWSTDGKRLYAGDPDGQDSFLVDPPVATTIARSNEHITTSLRSDRWCSRNDGVDGGAQTCFVRGVGPVLYTSDAFSCASRSHVLERR